MDLSAWIDEDIGWIVLNRPQVKNAISREMWELLPHALKSLKEERARVVIFRGEGDAFAAGADLGELSQLDTIEKAREHWDAIRMALNAVASFDLPTIAMIVGPCMGGGCLLAAACDMRFCEPSARFSVPIAQLGLTLDYDNLDRLISILGKGIASELLFTGTVMSATKAQQVGLVNGMMPLAQLERAVTDIAEDIKRNSSVSIAQTKRAIAEVCRHGRVEEDQEAVVASYLSDDFRLRVAKALSRKL